MNAQNKLQLPGYRILRPIGSGGMAHVYLAVEEQLERHVALKIIKQHEELSEEFAQRFLREAKTVSGLAHPHIVPVFAMKQMGGEYVIAMEYLSGGDLKQRIRQGLTVAESLQICLDIAKALSYAHHKGITHRDLKPDNILFREFGSAVLTDFGIARVQQDGDTTRLTVTDMVMGTPSYMSPEQFESPDVGPQSDLYSLGVILFEMLTGVCPFKAASMASTMKKHYFNPIPKLPDSLAPLQKLMDGLLAKTPEDRTKSADNLIHELEELISSLDNEVLSSKPASSMESEAETHLVTPSGSNVKPLIVDQEGDPTSLSASSSITGNEAKSGSPLHPPTEPEAKTLHIDSSDDSIVIPKKKALGLLAALVGLVVVSLILFVSNRQPTNPAPTTRPTDTNNESSHQPLAASATQSSQAPVQVRGNESIGDNEASNKNHSDSSLLPLTIEVKPSDARIRILNIVPKYQPGILLEPGEYIIELTADGYQQHIQSIELNGGAQRFSFQLVKIYTFKDKLKSGPLGPEMVSIPKGVYSMGCQTGECAKDALPVHEVHFDYSFAIAIHETTFDEYNHFATLTSRKIPNDSGWGRGSRPVINVSWNDAKAYAEWLSDQTGMNYRLPSEAEWEYAARPKNNSAYFWGNKVSKGAASCATCGSQWDNKSTAPVGQFTPTQWGIHDLFGNVWEWTEDCVNESYQNAPSNGSPWLKGDCDLKILRGGAFSSPASNLAVHYRYWNLKTLKKNNYGFRVVRILN